MSPTTKKQIKVDNHTLYDIYEKYSAPNVSALLKQVMAVERIHVHLVRCPNCDQLLPELPHLTIYLCGCCNITLQAKKQGQSLETSSEIMEIASFTGSSNKDLYSEIKSTPASKTGSKIDPKEETADILKQNKKNSYIPEVIAIAGYQNKDRYKQEVSRWSDEYITESSTKRRYKKHRCHSEDLQNISNINSNANSSTKSFEYEIIRKVDELTEQLGISSKISEKTIIKHNSKSKQMRKLTCRPINGAAPFISCHNCFELLHLPDVIVRKTKTQHRIRCCWCYQLISFKYAGTKLVISDIPEVMKQIYGCDSSYPVSENELMIDKEILQKQASQLSISESLLEVPEKISLASSLRLSEISEPILLRNISINSVYDFPLESNMEKPDLSQDSWKIISRKDDTPKVKRSNWSRNSFFKSLSIKSFKTSSKVFVNHHAISDDSVKKAGNLAGQIHPGNYWYDYHAGFWGTNGHPCLGIIPPFIEELRYPMARNCSGGNTGVYVNGRELHQKDLALLVSKGLPLIRNQSYIIDFSGEVLDETTGDRMCSLGKLAPTVEKLGRGFGMCNPRSAT